MPSMYDDGEDSSAPNRPGQPSEPGPADSQEDEGAYATLPKTFLAGIDCKPGDRIVCKIDSMHENEVVVCKPEKEGTSEEEQGEGEAPEPTEEPSETPSGSSNDLESMMM